MALIKQIITNKGTTLYHIIDSVEFVHFGTVLSWRAKYRSFASVEDYVDISKSPLVSGTVANIPIVPLGSNDPINVFEEKLTTIPSSPFFGAELVTASQQGVTLSVEKQQQIALVNGARDAELNNGFDTSYGRFSSDSTAVLNFVGTAVIANSMPSEWTVDWTLANNSYVTLTKAQFLEVALILGNFRNTTYAKGRTLVDQINAATTVEEVTAVIW